MPAPSPTNTSIQNTTDGTESVPQNPPQQYSIAPTIPTTDTSALPLPRTAHRHIWIITGPAGCGKTTVAAFLARTYGLPYLEGDAFHPPANIEKMAAGHPLSDEDRWEWLERVREAAVKAVSLRPSAKHGESKTKEYAAEERAETNGQVPSTKGVDLPTTSLTPGGVAAEHPDEAGRANGESGVAAQAALLTCSALKRSYRDVLRKAEREKGVKVHFVYLALSEEVLYRRVRERVGHYMKESMVRSQLEVLEEPGSEERGRDTVVLDATGSKETVEKEVRQAFIRSMELDQD